MKIIKEYNRFKVDNIYKALYVTPIILDKTHCHIIEMYDIDFRKSISELCKFINQKYKEDIVLKMHRRVQPGLIIKKNSNIQHIATDIYHFLNDKKLNCRIVYGEGEIDDIGNDIHSSYGKLLQKIGTKGDDLKNKKGIFKA